MIDYDNQTTTMTILLVPGRKAGLSSQHNPTAHNPSIN